MEVQNRFAEYYKFVVILTLGRLQNLFMILPLGGSATTPRVFFFVTSLREKYWLLNLLKAV
jgi:hypothetical protein